jgi:hypothetical protein
MGKIRERFKDDVEGLAQWVGRKLRNHNPMSQRVGKTTMPRMWPKVQVGIVAFDRNKVIYALSDGRRFEMSVRELDTDEETPKLVAVGD